MEAEVKGPTHGDLEVCLLWMERQSGRREGSHPALLYAHSTAIEGVEISQRQLTTRRNSKPTGPEQRRSHTVGSSRPLGGMEHMRMDSKGFAPGVSGAL